MATDQQFGRTRERECAGGTGRAGRSEDGYRLAFLFRMVGSLSLAVSSTAAMNSPGKVDNQSIANPMAGSSLTIRHQALSPGHIDVYPPSTGSVMPVI